MGDDRPSAYEENGVGIYRMSATGQCSRILLNARRGIKGAPPPDLIQARWDEGHTAEPMVLRRVRQGTFTLRGGSGTGVGAGEEDINVDGKVMFRQFDPLDDTAYNLLLGMFHPPRPVHVRREYLEGEGAEGAVASEGPAQFTCMIPIAGMPGEKSIYVRGHLDAIMQVSFIATGWMGGVHPIDRRVGDMVVVEVKKFRETLWKRYLKEGIRGFPGYMEQLTLAMHATRLPGLFAVGQWIVDDDVAEGGHIGDVYAEYFPEPPASFAAIGEQLLEVEYRYRRGAEFDECDVQTYPCPYWMEFHAGGADEGSGGSGEGLPYVADVGINQALFKSARRYGDLQNSKFVVEKALKEEKASLLAQIKKLGVSSGLANPQQVKVKVKSANGLLEVEVSVTIKQVEAAVIERKAYQSTTIKVTRENQE